MEPRIEGRPEIYYKRSTMSYYRIKIDGSNFLVDKDGQLSRMGFIVLCDLQAEDPEAAEYKAVDMLRQDEDLRSIIRNDKDDPPVMDVMEIVEFEGDLNEDSLSGKVWYEMDKPKQKKARWWGRLF